MTDFRLISLWRGKKTKNYYVNFHSHNYYELVYYPVGNGKTTIGEHTYNFTDNCFAVIPPGVCHDERHLADSEVICLVFSVNFQLQQSFKKDSFNTVYKILTALLEEVGTQRYGYKAMINAKLTELCLNILRSENSTADDKNFEYIINYIKENYHEKIILAQCASQLNLSYDYFQHKFKLITGLSPQQFLVKQRLKASKSMLLNTNLNCTEISYRCGFSTSSQYSALFKREYGISPLKFRNTET